MIATRDDKNDKGPKKRSILGLLFNPEFGSDIKPIGESVGMFVRLVAMIFAMNKLFPKDHPALRGDPSARLTMRDVVATAWRGLSFTRDGLPQVVIFIAVVGTLIFSALLMLTAFFSLFVGQARAAGGMFDDAGQYDWGKNWIEYIFLGTPFTAPGDSSTSVSDTTDVQDALKSALAYYSGGILVFAGVILLYHLMSMVAETAHSGKVMGQRANQIWAPVRLVVAIGLLVPIAGGLNSGQYIVIQMAKWGSGLASQTWSRFQTALNNTSTGSTQAGSPSNIQISPNVRDVALGMISNYACMMIYNDYWDRSGLGDEAEYAIYNPTSSTSGTYYFGSMESGKHKYCGGYIINPIPTTPYSPIYQAQQDVFNNYKERFLELAFNNYKRYIPEDPESLVDQDMNNEEVAELLTSFENDLKSNVQSALAQADLDAVNAGENLSNPLFSEGGWMSAGAWFNTIMRLQSNRQSSIYGSLPRVVKPGIFEAEKEVKAKGGKIDSSDQRTIEALRKFNAWMQYSGETPSTASEQALNISHESIAKRILDSVNPIEFLFWLVDTAGQTFNLWGSNGELAIKFDKTKNPLSEVAAFGQNNLNLATWFLTAAGVLQVAAAATDSNAVGKWITFGLAGGLAKGMEFLSAILLIFATIFFLTGISLGFMLPLFPFVRFFFGSLTWIIGVFEAVVAVPLLALAHLNPEGDGLPGASARGGYYYVLNVFLRPVLMVFGLVAGFLLFMVAVSFLNSVFIIAAKGTGAFAGPLPTLAKIFFTVIYCGLVYICANNCFKAIGMFPQQALRWLGSGGHEEKMGDTSTMSAVLGGVSTYLVNQGMQNIAGAPSKMLGGSAGAKKLAEDKQDALNAQLVGADRHDQAMLAQNFSAGITPGEYDLANEVPVTTTAALQPTNRPDIDSNPKLLLATRVEEEARHRLKDLRRLPGYDAAAKTNLVRQITAQYRDSHIVPHGLNENEIVSSVDNKL